MINMSKASFFNKIPSPKGLLFFVFMVINFSFCYANFVDENHKSENPIYSDEIIGLLHQKKNVG